MTIDNMPIYKQLLRLIRTGLQQFVTSKLNISYTFLFFMLDFSFWKKGVDVVDSQKCTKPGKENFSAYLDSNTCLTHITVKQATQLGSALRYFYKMFFVAKIN